MCCLAASVSVLIGDLLIVTTSYLPTSQISVTGDLLIVTMSYLAALSVVTISCGLAASQF